MARFRVLTAAFVLALVLGIVVGGVGQDEGSPFTEAALAATLTPFGDCDDLLGYFRQTALERVGPYGLGGGHPVLEGVAEADAADASVGAGEEAAAAPAERAAPQPDAFSGTNVQEVGVDEPDLVKTDGRRLVTLAGGRLQVLDVTDAEPRLLGTLELEGMWGQDLLLDGDRVLVLGHSDGAVGRPMPTEPGAGDAGAARDVMPVHAPVAMLRAVDLADPADPRVTSTLALDGAYVSARMVDGVARVVMRSQPTGLAFTFPEGGGIRAEREATERNREVIASSTIENWLPWYVAETAAGTREGVALDCDRVHRPAEPAGVGVLSVLTVPLDADLSPGEGTAVVAEGETVYASTDDLYVAWSRWDGAVIPVDAELPVDEPDRGTTEVHQFDISDPSTARYVASGAIEGRLLNQFSLSEHEGHLRVATTTGETSAFRGGEPNSSSSVVVLRAEGEDLVEVGRVDGLGPGERIYAVRFLGPVGYVVTFRETDPLYTVDLSDPTAPRVRGELKIPGFSAYLHPLDDGLLLGVGQDVDEDTGERLGTQLSLFDVRDLDDPRRIHHTTLDGFSSPVEHDHRAFLHWPATGLIALPAERYVWSEEDGEPTDVFSGLLGFTVDEAGGFAEVGRITHAEAADGKADPHGWVPPVQRSVVVGERLLTISELGVLTSDVDSFAELGWVGFPPPR